MGKAFIISPIDDESAPEAGAVDFDSLGECADRKSAAAAAFIYSTAGARESAEALVQVLVSVISVDTAPYPEAG
ncbi:hypothetical protein DSC45_34535 [Streptomyces sp. YIM 130001]|nr:hypothetical protein DSC45_34535 [Streptomyces sp. YIM 130001]